MKKPIDKKDVVLCRTCKSDVTPQPPVPAKGKNTGKLWIGYECHTCGSRWGKLKNV